MAKMVVEIELDLSSAQMQQMLPQNADNPKAFVTQFKNLLDGLSGGVYNGVINCKLGAVQGSRSGTFTGVPLNNETCVINGVTFTAKTSGATGDQFNIGGSAALTATAMISAINASTTAGILDVILASSGGSGVVTLTSKQAGKVGNAIDLTEAFTNFTWAGAVFTGGTQDTNKTYVFSKAATTAY